MQLTIADVVEVPLELRQTTAAQESELGVERTGPEWENVKGVEKELAPIWHLKEPKKPEPEARCGGCGYLLKHAPRGRG